ncbi:MAG: F0F1 ATP synthase subunit A [Oscillospiraceae bacterium]|nr:F0F1 ATP synthase subunit A [Oscillospiraceae bacterium]
MSYLPMLSEFSVEGPIVVADFGKFMGIPIRLTESITVQWLIILIFGVLFFVLGRNLEVKPTTRRQVIAEMIVGTLNGMVNDTMGPKYFRYQPYIGALLMFSLGLSISVYLGMLPPTADISVIATWGVLTFMLTNYNRFKSGGLLRGAKSFAKPIFLLPSNLISEISNPMSQTFRHYGNILAGLIIGGLIFWALQMAIKIPILIPVPLSLYFDLFQGFLQAYVFATLTMVYISMADTSPEAEEA